MTSFAEKSAIQTFIKEHEPSLIKHVAELVKIPSVSADLTAVGAALSYALNLGHALGFEAKMLLDGQVGTIEMGEGPETLGILVHVDVVDAGDLEKWESPPFVPTLRDGKIYGRGTLDDKGALVAALYGMKAVAALGQPLHKKVQLIIGTQEEAEWTDMRAFAKTYPLPDYGFTPDGEYPICNIEKGVMDIVLAFPLKDLAESWGNGRYLTDIAGGTASNVVPGTCSCQIAEFKDGQASTSQIKTRGVAVHSSQPEKGENAILKMNKKLQEEGLQPNSLWSLLQKLGDLLADPYGSGIGLYSDSEYFAGEFVHRTVLSPTVLKIKGNQLRLNVNVRYPYGTAAQDIIAAFQAMAARERGTIYQIDDLPPVYISREKPFIKELAKDYEAVSGRKNEFMLAHGGSYAKAMPNIVSWGPIFPGEIDSCHEENEFISVDSLMLNTSIFATAISRIALTEKSFR